MTRFGELERSLRARGIRLTMQRQLIARRAIAFLHFTAEQLVHSVRSIDCSISRATVYRTLCLLHEAGVVEKHDFRYGPPNYEVTFGKSHHDHLMCVRCAEIIEFKEPQVERLQEGVTRRYGYRLMSHTHKLYGLCRVCQRRHLKQAPRRPRLHVERAVA